LYTWPPTLTHALSLFLSTCSGGKRQLRPHQIWGAEHLLRFITLLPKLLVPLPPPPPVDERAEPTRKSKGRHAEKDKDKDKKEKEKEKEVDHEEVKQDLAKTGAFLQALLAHLDENRDAFFINTVTPPKDYGMDVPRIQLKHG
jgi:hypothetical protein